MKKNLAIFIIVAILYTMLPTLATNSIFSDVPHSHWAKEQIEFLVSQKIVSGMGDGTFAYDMG